MSLMSGLNLPHINGVKLSKSWIALSVRRSLEEHVWPFFDALGADNIKLLIAEKKPLFAAIPPDKLPEEWMELLSVARGNRWAMAAIGSDDLQKLIPDWMVAIVTSDDKAWAWYIAEIEYLRTLIFAEVTS